MTIAPACQTSAADIGIEIDRARTRGALQQIVVPPCPEPLARLQLAIGAREPDLAQVARIASGDVAMAATLLRNANGPLFAAGQPARTVGQAMDRLGLRQTATIMTGFLVRNAIPADPRHLHGFWEQAGLRALALGFVARQLPGLAPDLAHTYGLFCHVGLPVLLQSVHGYRSTLVEAGARVDRPFIATENANHRTDHAVVGALVARVWRLAPEVMAAIRLHHDLQVLAAEAAEADVLTLLAAGLVADHLLRRQTALPPDAEWTANSAGALRWLQVDGAELAAWEEELSVVLADA